MNKKHSKIKSVVSCISFCLIALYLFTRCTYLFRTTVTSERRSLLGFYLEEKDSLDVVYVGASSTYRYFSPMEAWHTSGITVFDYAVSSMHMSSYLTALEDIEKTQSPSLILLDGRRFLNGKTNEFPYEKLRYYTDSLDLGITRTKGILRSLHYYGLSLKDNISYLIDLMLYHSNYKAMEKKLNWQMSDNRVSKDTKWLYPKGFGMAAKVKPLDPPTAVNTTEVGELESITEKMYRDLLSYCSKKDYSVAVVIAPYVVSESDMVQYNALALIAEEYGIPFLNTNCCLDEIGLDFSKDFYNTHHSNLWGAEKYTHFLTNWILSHYELEDKRDDPAYASWNSDYEAYSVKAEKAYEKLRKACAAG